VKALTKIALVSLIAAAVSVTTLAQSQSEIDEAAQAHAAFVKTMSAFRSAKNWWPLLDQLERDAKQYVGKSKVQIAYVSNSPLSAVQKRKLTIMFEKADETAAQAIRFTAAAHKAWNSVKKEDLDEAETERLKFIDASKDWARAGLDATGH
jgi:hypothetical protein